MARPGVTRSKVTLLLLLIFSALGFLLGSPAMATVGAATTTPIPPPAHGLVILYLVNGLTFEQAMAVPEFAGLARRGGAALMTTRADQAEGFRSQYRTIGAGAIAPPGTPGLLARALAAHGVRTCLIGDGIGPPVFVRLGALVVSGNDLHVPCDLGDLVPTWPPDWDSSVGPLLGSDAVLVVDTQAVPPAFRGSALSNLLALAGNVRCLLLVAEPQPSGPMTVVGDEVTPIMAATGPAQDLLFRHGGAHALTSDTTRQSGLVANVDVAPTILRFFGLPIPSQMTGQPIRTTDDPAPFALHRLELDSRRIRLPIQLGALAFIVISGVVMIVGLAWLVVRGALPPWTARALRFLALAGVATPIALMAGGLLPRQPYAVVVPFLVAVIVGLAVMATATGWPWPRGPFVFLGLVGLSLFVVDSLFGERALRVPLLGGTMFDGVRFYGIPNALIGILLASAVFVAASSPPLPGTILLVAAGLFAGFPHLGADLGGAVMLFTAAGLWWVLGTRRRFTVREVVVVAGVVVVGLGVVVLANRYLPGARTHIGRFVEGTGGTGVLHTLRHRIGLAFAQVAHVPGGLVPIVGLVLIAGLVVAGPPAVKRAFEDHPRWRAAIIAICVASLVGFVVNDTGVSAAAPGFLYALAAMSAPLLAPGGRHPAGVVAHE